MKPDLVLMRIERGLDTSSSKNSPPVSNPRTLETVNFTGTAQWDTNHPFHLAVLESAGILQTYMLETTGGGSKAYLYPRASFQLHLLFGSLDSPIKQSSVWPNNSPDDYLDKKAHSDGIGGLCFGHDMHYNQDTSETKSIENVWGSFEFIPKRPSEIVFFQADSSRILFARLPGGSPRCLHIKDRTMASVEPDRSKVYLVGRHSSTILSIAVRPDGLVLASAAKDGCLRVWRLSDGSMIAQTMFARWREPRSPDQQTSNSSSRSLGHDFEFEDTINIKSSASRVIRFFGKSWDLAMGCPNGEVRIWSMQSESIPLTITEVGSVVSGKAAISSIALHVPDCNFPIQSNVVNEKKCSSSHGANLRLKDLLAIGTTNGKVQVWTKHTLCYEWTPTWGIISSEEGRIICLSFRADGGLLAVAVSMLANPRDDISNAQSIGKSFSNNLKVTDYLYLYDTSTWACIGSLNFASKLGSCLFYCPYFKMEDKDDPKSCASREKVSSCRMLLVSTSTGPQTHILPEHGLFGFIHDEECEQQQIAPFDYRKEAKTVQWADLKRGLELNLQSHKSKNHQQEEDFRHIEVEGEGNSGGCKTKPLQSEHNIGSNFVASSTFDLHTTNTSSMPSFGKDKTSSQKASKKRPPCSPHPSPCKSRLLSNFKISSKKPLQKQALEYSQENIGLQDLRNGVLEGCKSSHRHHGTPSKNKTKTISFFLISKDVKSKSQSNSVSSVKPNFEKAKPKSKHKQNPSTYISSQPDQRQQQQRRLSRFNSLFHSQSPPNLHIRKKCKNPKEYWQDHINESNESKDSIANEKDSHSNATIYTSLENDLNQVEVNFKKVKGKLNSNVNDPLLGNTLPLSKLSFVTTKTDKECPSPILVDKTSKSTTFSSPTEFHGKENLHSTNRTHTRSTHYSQNNVLGNIKENVVEQQAGRIPRKGQGCDHNLEAHKIGGKNLVELLVMNEVSFPLIKMAQVGRTSKTKSPTMALGALFDRSKISSEECKRMLDQPKAFSTTNLMHRLQEIEQEKFDIEAACQVAKLKGIVLSKNDKEELKAALRVDQEHQVWSPQLRAHKPSERYIPLLKILDPRVAHNGPFVAPRKARKRITPKGEDNVLCTMQPDLMDLWDLQERCPQVSSSEHANSGWAMNWRKSLGKDIHEHDVWAEREAMGRAIASAQALYDSCVYRPN